MDGSGTVESYPVPTAVCRKVPRPVLSGEAKGSASAPLRWLIVAPGSGERARGSEARPPVPGWWGWQCPRPGFWGAVAGPTSFKNLDSLHPPHTPKVFPVDGGRGGFFPTFLSLGVDGAGDSRELWCQVPPGRSQTRQQRGERRRRGPNLPGRRARPGPQVFGDCCARISFYLPRTPRSGNTGHAYSAAEDSVFRDRPGPVSGTPRVGGS